MGTLFDYLDWRGDLSFRQVPLCEVDNQILSQICYVNFEGVVPRELDGRGVLLNAAAKSYLRAHRGEPAYLGAILPPKTLTLLAKAAKTPRFGKIRLIGYENLVREEDQTQFCAVTCLLDDGSTFVAYRGTDDTLVGWKENFNMSFLHPVPAQTEAVRYLEEVAAHTEGRLLLGGHSKGGNLAIYAAVKSSPAVRERLLVAYSNDGPGFTREFIEGEDYLAVKGRLRTLVPQSSVVGMLLEHEESFEVVKSNQTGLWQHDAFSWEVLGNAFIHLDDLDEESRQIHRTLKEWLDEMDTKQRSEFVDAIYDTLIATNATTLTDITTDKLKLLRAWSALDEEKRSLLLKSIRLLFFGAGKRTRKSAPPERKSGGK